MDRKTATDLIVNALYGAPGESWDTTTGRELVNDLLDEMGLAALSDEAVIRLAGMHRDQDERNGRRITAAALEDGRSS